MPNIGPAELIVILLVALVVFGPRKLPELGKSLGAGLREFRRSTQSLKDDFDGSLRDAPAGPAQTIAPAATQAAQPQAAQLHAQPQTIQPQPAAQAAVPADAVAVPTPSGADPR